MAGALVFSGALAALPVVLLFLAWRRGGARAALVFLLALLAACGLGEATLRALGLGVPGRPEWLEPLRRGSPSESAYWPDSELVYTYPSDPRGYFDAQGRVVGHVNSLGLRGADCTLEPVSGRTRIAMLGDSFTLGIGVRDEDTLPARLERELGADRHEVLDFGVSATDTLEQVAYLEGYVLRFRPRVVVLVFFLNDTERGSTIDYLTRPHVLVAARRRSWLLNLVVGRLERAALRDDMLENYREGYTPDSPAWRAVRDALAHAHELCEARGVELVLAIHPVLVDLARGSYPFADIHATVRAFCEQQAIPVVDLYEALADRRASELWVHPNDQHPNERCDALTARYLAERLRSGLLPR